MIHWVHDYETLSNCFVAVFEHYKTDEKKIFIIHELQNDFPALLDFFERNVELQERHISYNGLAFDGQITEYILQNKAYYNSMTGDELAKELYGKAQYVISKSNRREWLDFYERDMQIPQIDVFKLNHWDNAAKRSSLKWIQFSMDWFNLQDMPIHHEASITTREEIDMIVSYCINDVSSTKKILYLSKDQLALRVSLSKEYNINLYSASEPKISKELFLHFLSKATGESKWDIKKLQTIRTYINAKDLILPYTKFNHPVLKKLLEDFRGTVINAEDTKGSLKLSVNLHGAKIDFGLGGVHGAKRSGVYKAGNGMTIMTSDVKSYYPNLAIKNKWSPAHIDKEAFCKLYGWFYDERVKIPKSDIRNYVYKIILNSTYGLSNDKYSYLYDPLFTMQITINGQLSLMMLYEMIMEAIPGAIPLMQNTDGLETMIPEEYKEKYLEVCNEWEKMTQLQLDHDEYQKLVLADVNNYIAINKFEEVTKEKYDKFVKNHFELVKEENGKFYHAATKCKGRFEFRNLALHKNKSHLVIPKALFKFFVHDVSPETYLATNRNIFDYCIGKKIKGDWNFKQRQITDGEFIQKDLQKTLRYYISNKGVKIIKCHNHDGREIQVESGRPLMTIYNIVRDDSWEAYDVDEQYYQRAVYKEIENIAGSRLQQLKLF